MFIIFGAVASVTTREIGVLQHSAPASPLVCVLFSSLFRRGGCLCFSLSVVPASTRETSKELVHDDDKEGARLSGAEESYGGYLRRRIAKLAVKRKAWPLTSETLGAPRRHQAGRRLFIHQRVTAQEETLLMKSCLQERKDWSQTFPVYTESFY